MTASAQQAKPKLELNEQTFAMIEAAKAHIRRQGESGKARRDVTVRADTRYLTLITDYIEQMENVIEFDRQSFQERVAELEGQLVALRIRDRADRERTLKHIGAGVALWDTRPRWAFWRILNWRRLMRRWFWDANALKLDLREREAA